MIESGPVVRCPSVRRMITAEPYEPGGTGLKLAGGRRLVSGPELKVETS